MHNKFKAIKTVRNQNPLVILLFPKKFVVRRLNEEIMSTLDMNVNDDEDKDHEDEEDGNLVYSDDVQDDDDDDVEDVNDEEVVRNRRTVPPANFVVAQPERLQATNNVQSCRNLPILQLTTSVSAAATWRKSSASSPPNTGSSSTTFGKILKL